MKEDAMSRLPCGWRLPILLLMWGIAGVLAGAQSYIETSARDSQADKEIDGRAVVWMERYVYLVLKPNCPDSWRYCLSYRGTIDKVTGRLRSDCPNIWSSFNTPWNNGYLRLYVWRDGKSIDYFVDKTPTFTVAQEKQPTAVVHMDYTGADLDCRLTYTYSVIDRKLRLDVSLAPKVPIDRYQLLLQATMQGGEGQFAQTPVRTIARASAPSMDKAIALDPLTEYRLVFSSTDPTKARAFALVSLPGQATGASLGFPGAIRVLFDYSAATKRATFLLYEPWNDAPAGLAFLNGITISKTATP
jgi:hypothetical protein